MKKSVSAQKKLIFLCWLLYSVAYTGRYSYSANINLTMAEYAVTRAEAGLVTSCFFFAYGLGQILHGFLSRYVSRRFMLPVAMFLAAGVNLVLFFGAVPFSWVKYLWALNGMAQAALWPNLMRILGTSLTDDYRPRAVFAMGTTTATGTFTAYFASFLFVRFLSYRFSFLFAAAGMAAAGLVWLFSYDELADPADLVPAKKEKGENAPKKALGTALTALLVTVCLFAVISNFVKDGLQLWVPNVLKQNFSLPDDFSILLTMFLPLLNIIGSTFAVMLQKKMPNFIAMETVFFALSGLAAFGVVSFLQVALVPALISFGVTGMFQASVNNTNTSMVPIYMSHKADSGLLAGIINACCYLGSTFSSYGLGALADSLGWQSVFRILLGLILTPVVIGSVILIIRRLEPRRIDWVKWD